jgi:ADP-heptose:LPS heptosyltransferase
MSTPVNLSAPRRGLVPGLHFGGARLRLALLWQLRKEGAWFVRTALRRGRPDRIIHFGIGPGDDLLCTAVIREMKKRGHKKIWMMSQNPELFEHNGDVDQVIPIDYRFRDYAWVWGKKWHVLEYARLHAAEDRSEPPQRHILAELCGRMDVRGDVALRPYFHLTGPERTAADWARGMIAVQSSGLGGQMLMRNKQWYPERFQEVVGHFQNRLRFVQLGSATDPALAGATDLRGRTRMRESAAILANCRLFLGNVGFLMHLARAVECPALIVYGGREAPWQSGYGCNLNLYSAVPCAPCWLWNKCDYDRRCMDQISAGQVIAGIEEMLARPRNPLAADRLTL